jgi:hypothetical protein
LAPACAKNLPYLAGAVILPLAVLRQNVLIFPRLAVASAISGLKARN